MMMCGENIYFQKCFKNAMSDNMDKWDVVLIAAILIIGGLLWG